MTQRLLDLGKTVIVAGLCGDFRQQPFPNGILDLVAMAEEVRKLSAVCDVCAEPTPPSLSQQTQNCPRRTLFFPGIILGGRDGEVPRYCA